MRTKSILLAFMLLLLSCGGGLEEYYDLTYAYVGTTDSCTFFTQGDVKLCVNEDFEMYNLGTSKVEFAFVKNLVYRIQMINKIPTSGWSETIEHVNLQDGYVGRLLLDDGSYEYCRFYIYNIAYDADANQYVLFKYQSDFKKN